jgi:hypothetical protein
MPQAFKGFVGQNIPAHGILANRFLFCPMAAAA